MLYACDILNTLIPQEQLGIASLPVSGAATLGCVAGYIRRGEAEAEIVVVLAGAVLNAFGHAEAFRRTSAERERRWMASRKPMCWDP